MVATLQEVAGQLGGVSHIELLDRPTFVAEDVAFFNGERQASFYPLWREPRCCAGLFCFKSHNAVFFATNEQT